MIDSQVFPRLELLGWYTTGPIDDPLNRRLEKSLSSFNEHPFCLSFDVLLAERQNFTVDSSLPVHLWQSRVVVSQGSISMVWDRVPLSVNTENAERIAIDGLARAGGDDKDGCT
jgi:hypothetical protein